LTRKVLITGGAGFIGSHVGDLFIEKGWQVDVIDNLSSGKMENLSPRVHEFTKADITEPAAAERIRNGSYDAVCHLAAQIDVRKSVADPVFDARVNILGTLSLLEAVRASGRPTRFVFSSTGGAIYGDFVTPPSAEDAAKEPEAPYGTSKLSIEYYLAFYARVLQLDTVALRYSNVYGPRQDPHGEAGVVAIFCGRILEGKPLTVFGDGQQTRDYVFAGDVARANFLAATSPLPRPGRVDARSFNIGTGVETSVIELARILRECGRSDVPLDHAPARVGELQRSAVDPRKAYDTFGWRAEMTIRDGLARTFDWFAAQRSGVGADGR
jgi:UDP-glucose 4-epimerase